MVPPLKGSEKSSGIKYPSLKIDKSDSLELYSFGNHFPLTFSHLQRVLVMSTNSF